MGDEGKCKMCGRLSGRLFGQRIAQGVEGSCRRAAKQEIVIQLADEGGDKRGSWKHDVQYGAAQGGGVDRAFEEKRQKVGEGGCNGVGR